MSTPIWIGDQSALSFGWYHRASGKQRDVGVVLCSPLGYEAMCVHRTYRVLAERLAADGFPVVRFDYHGTGDSAGTELDPQRLSAWKTSIKAAADAVQRNASVEKIVLFGLRFGATLALITAAEMSHVAAVIAWAPLASGKAYIRELRAFNKLKGEVATSTTELETAGFLLPNATVAELQQLDLTSIAEPVAPHVLVLQRDASSGESKLATHLGASIEMIPGYETMMRDPHEAVVPTEVIERVASWLRDSFPALEGSGAGGPLSLHEHPVDSALEQPLFFGPESQLFGILTRGPTWVRTRPLVIFLNTGSNHHVGSQRMSVVLARRLASLGFASFRFDIAGLGDSAFVGDARGKRHYAPDAVGDVHAAMAVLKTAVGIEQFVVVGLCSGAYLAFNTTHQTPSVVGQVLINLQSALFVAEQHASAKAVYKSNRHYKEKLFEPETYKRLLRGDINVSGIGKAVATRLVRRIRNDVRDRLRGSPVDVPRNQVEAAFFAIANRGTDSLVIFSSDDAGIDQLRELMGDRMERLRRNPHVQHHIIDGADHTFTRVEPRARLLDLIVNHITQRFG